MAEKISTKHKQTLNSLSNKVHKSV